MFGLRIQPSSKKASFSGRFLRCISVLSFAFLCSASPALAYTSPGNPSNYVNDFAHVLSPETVQSLNAELSQFEASTSNQIAVVTVPNMGGDYIEHYAVKLFEDWKIGQRDKDNGVLLLLAIDERKIRIEVGYGLEGALPDSVAQSIINNDLTPNLKAGNFDEGVLQAVRDIQAATQYEYTGDGGTTDGKDMVNFYMGIIFFALFAMQWIAAILARSKSWWGGGIVGAVLGFGIWGFLGFVIFQGIAVVVVLTLLGLLLDFLISRAYTNSKNRGGRTPWWAGGGGFGSGRGGGGFGGFGGGSSGGGGASGSW